MRKRALLIGIDQYKDTQIMPLRCAENDAHAMGAFLEFKCGFEQVKYLHGNSASFTQVIEHLDDIGRELQQEDLFFLYFSGHGYEHPQHGHSLILHNSLRRTLMDLPHDVLPIRSLQEHLRCMSCRQIVFMMDACRSNLDSDRGGVTSGFEETIARDIAPLSGNPAVRDFRLICSCSPSEQSFELLEKGRGAFTLAFTEVAKQRIDKGAGFVLDTALMMEVEAELNQLLCKHGLSDRHQRPWLQGGSAPIVFVPGQIPSPPAPASISRQVSTDRDAQNNVIRSMARVFIDQTSGKWDEKSWLSFLVQIYKDPFNAGVSQGRIEKILTFEKEVWERNQPQKKPVHSESTGYNPDSFTEKTRRQASKNNRAEYQPIPVRPINQATADASGTTIGPVFEQGKTEIKRNVQDNTVKNPTAHLMPVFPIRPSSSINNGVVNHEGDMDATTSSAKQSGMKPMVPNALFNTSQNRKEVGISTDSTVQNNTYKKKIPGKSLFDKK